MIEICNIRKERNEEWTKLLVDVVVTEIDNPLKKKQCGLL